ncbi:MAG: CpsB/CapC family capsule biosynthesis tyrosine phosphatase [Actinomycetota bacterium]
MIDLHCHILPGVDDGPSSTAVAVEMARVAHRSGIRTIVATPHMADRHPTTPRQVADGVARLREALAAADVPVEVLPGGEIALDHLPRLGDGGLAGATLGGGGRWVLLEMPFRGWPLALPRILRDLELRGLGAVLAHPERADAVQRQPARLRELVGQGMLVQITAMSLTGENGDLARRTAETLLRDGMAHFIASDGHSPGRRPPVVAEGLEAAARVLRTEPGELAWMVDEGPRLVVEGRAVRPPRLTPAGRTPPAAARPGPAARPRSPRR